MPIGTTGSESGIFLTLVKINLQLCMAIPPLVVDQSTSVIPFWKATRMGY